MKHLLIIAILLISLLVATPAFADDSDMKTIGLSATIVAPPAPPSGGSVGGGGGATLYTFKASDGVATLTVPIGTIVKNKNGNQIPAYTVRVKINLDPPAPPKATNIIGMSYNYEPSGATFKPPLTMTFKYDPALIPNGVAEKDLVLAFYDAELGEWVKLECVVDTKNKTITALVSHFTEFAILAKTVIVDVKDEPPPPVVIIPALPPAVVPKPEPVSPAPTVPEAPTDLKVVKPEPFVPETPSPVLPPERATPWLLITLIAVGIFTVIGLIWWKRRKKNHIEYTK